MATDWSSREAARPHFEKLLRKLKALGDDEVPLYEAAVYALRRSQDHTAIQNKLKEFKLAAETNAETVREQQREIARLHGLLAEILADDKACGYLNASLTRRIHQLMGNTS